MGNKIYFKGSRDGPIQEDPVNAKESVKFYCNEKFWIIFGPEAAGHIDYDPPVGGFAPARNDPLEFEAVETSKGEWVIKVKFDDIPEEGWKYTVRLDANGKTLDPRVVPPK